MTNAEHPGDETDRAVESGDNDPAALKQRLFAAWIEAHPDGTRQQFDEAWLATTSEARPSEPTNDAPTSWEHDPLVLKGRMFEAWKGRHPDGTNEQFESEWDALTSLRGV